MFDALRNNKGAAMIFVAVAMVVMLSFAALAIDIGNVIVQKQRLQNAVDAAALAAASKLTDTAAATAEARLYMQKNGYSPSDITVEFSDHNKAVTVTATLTVDYTFARILGLSGKTVNPLAKAEIGLIGQAFDYVLFSGSETQDFTISGSKYAVYGSVHTNANFNGLGNDITITGACEAQGVVDVKPGMNIPTQISDAGYIAMPDFSETIRQQALACGTYYVGNKTFSSSSIDVTKPIYVDGNVTINGSGFKGIGCILATGNIVFNGSSLNITSTDMCCLYSKNGSITINGAESVIEGILYAPKGSVVSNGLHQEVHGRVIANTLNMNGSGYTITVRGSIDDLKCLPPNTLRLVR